jgi:5-methylcytosine-specific restriction endonuclease McrA
VNTTCLDCGSVVRKRHHDTRCPSCMREREARRNAQPYRMAYRDPAYQAIPLVGRCVVCGSERDLTRDHVTSLVRGGGNEASNIVLMCRSCNSAKGARV